MRKGLSISSVIFFSCLIGLNTIAFGQTSRTASKSEVRLVNNVPRLFLNGKELNTVLVNVYYIYNPRMEDMPFQPKYGSEKWVNRIKSVIDEASSNGVKAIMLNVFWGDLDKSIRRPSNIGQNLDFSSLDIVMAYASQKNVHIILVTVLYPAIPEWWARENNFIPFNRQGPCDLCETDSYGNMYNNVSMNNDKVHHDFGSFIEAVIKRYKNHPALLGWNMGVGATGEDNYGPNYIDMIMGTPGGEKIERRPLMFTDYSPYFQRKFKEWMTNKYKTDKALQRAWGDNSVTLARLVIPRPEEMIIHAREWHQERRVGLFPDPSDVWWKGDVEVLTKKGLDFYDFRNYMRWADREYYAKLFRKNDPNHILIFTGLNEELLSPSLGDGITFNANLCFNVPPDQMNRDFYYHLISVVKNAVKHKKLVIITAESTDQPPPGRHDESLPPRPPSRWDIERQIKYIETVGKAVKCANGMFAYVVDLIDRDAPARFIPSWFSREAKAAAKRIVDYTPTKDCDCSLIRELYVSNSCGNINSPQGCGLLEKAYRSFCGGENIK